MKRGTSYQQLTDTKACVGRTITPYALLNAMIEKPTKEQLAFWEKVLHDHHLGMHRGRSNRVRYVDPKTLERKATKSVFGLDGQDNVLSPSEDNYSEESRP